MLGETLVHGAPEAAGVVRDGEVDEFVDDDGVQDGGRAMTRRQLKLREPREPSLEQLAQRVCWSRTLMAVTGGSAVWRRSATR